MSPSLGVHVMGILRKHQGSMMLPVVDRRAMSQSGPELAAGHDKMWCVEITFGGHISGSMRCMLIHMLHREHINSTAQI